MKRLSFIWKKKKNRRDYSEYVVIFRPRKGKISFLMKTTVPRKQMKMLEDQYEELSHLRIIATTIKLPQLNILKKEKQKTWEMKKQLEKFWDSFNMKFSKKKWKKKRRNGVNREKQWLKITAVTLSEIQIKIIITFTT